MIGENIRRIMKERKVTMVRLGEKMGTSQSSLSQILRDNISTAMIEKIATALEVEPWELFVTQEEIEAERKRRLEALAMPRASVMCPCCGRRICVTVAGS